jgi:translation initiation factor IF-3
MDREQFELEQRRKELELQQQAMKQAAELALQELKIKSEIAQQDEKTKTDQTKVIMDSLEKINNISRGDM